jgi:hypothetical protein
MQMIVENCGADVTFSKSAQTALPISILFNFVSAILSKSAHIQVVLDELPCRSNFVEM